jgi:hypothetical protein
MVITRNQGFSASFFQEVAVSSGSFSVTGPDAIINLAGGIAGFSLCNETGSTVVEVSFNGNTVDERLDASLPTRFVQYDSRAEGLIWLRMKTGGAATVVVRAWSPGL